MKSTLASLTFGALIAVAVASCWVDRRSSDFACTNDTDCASFSPERVCDTSAGYCVPGNNPGGCPNECTGGCNETQKTCTISCSNATQCNGTVACPAGWDCTINCGTGACDSVLCRPGSDCSINCVGAGACGDIECGDGACTVTCNGGGACGAIDCNDSACDVTCSGGGACPSVTCDNACRCDVDCTTGSSCGDVRCLDNTCETPTGGCDSSRTGCPNTCN